MAGLKLGEHATPPDAEADNHLMYPLTDGTMRIKNKDARENIVGQFTYQTVEVGVTTRVPTGHHWTVGSGFTIEGDLILDGDMTVL